LFLKDGRIVFTRPHDPKRRIAVKALVRFKQKVGGLTGRTRGIGIEQMAKELAGYLRGCKSYFGFSETPSVLERLNQWIRQRLRSVIWKQWKRGKRRFANLHQRGVGSKLAAQQLEARTVPGGLPTVLR
jgi:RNA-directed DNA polymerase